MAANRAFPWPPEAEDAEEEPRYFCPHETEVPTPGGACDRCATEDADDTPGYFFESWDEWPW